MVIFKRIIYDYKPITIEKNQKIKSLQIIENIYVCVTSQQKKIKEGCVILKIIIHGFSHWNLPNRFRYCKNITQKFKC